MFSFSAFAQGGQSGTLNGKLLDQKKITIPFATVAVMKAPDSTIVTGSTTDIDGNFELKAPSPGEYYLRFSAIGYTSTFSSRFQVEDPQYSRDFGAVIMKEEATMLNEVLIETWRPQVTMKGGNLKVRVDGTPLASGSTAFEVLSRAPGVVVDQDGNFTINGKGGVSIMLDGRFTYMSQQDLKNLLEGMSAEEIESIEVITNPSAKYDAEGSGGILNIKLKKNSLSGFNGRVYAGYRYNGLNGYNAGANLNYKKGDWNSFFNFDLRRTAREREAYMTKGFQLGNEPSSFVEQDNDETRTRIRPSVRFGTDYSISEDHMIGIMADLSYQKTENDWISSGNLFDYIEDETIGLASNNYNEEDFQNNRFNLHYEGKLGEKASKLSANFDYVQLDNETQSTFDNTYFFEESNIEENEELFSNSLNEYEIISGQVDYSTSLSENSQLDLGVKASEVVSESDLEFLINNDGELELDPSRSNEFRYEENIYAAYANFSSKLGEKWHLNAGLRLEQTEARGISATMNQTNENNYLEWFPSISLDQKVSDNYELSYAYNRRILRPDYENLNPFIFYIDPYTYVDGNPNLQPQISNSFQVTQSFFGKFNLILNYDKINGFIGEVPFQDPETSITAFRIRNMDTYRNLGATVVAPFQILKGWNTTNTIVVSDFKYGVTVNQTEVENQGTYFMAQSTHRINLPSEFSMEINAKYEGPVVYGIYSIDQRFGMDLGFRKSFLDERLDVTLNANDIFRSMRIVGNSNVNGNTTYVDQYLGGRSVSLNISYNLTSQKSQNENRQSNLEELDRAGGN